MIDRVFSHRISSPIGALRLLSNGDALVGLYTEEHKKFPSTSGAHVEDRGPFREVSRQLERYFDGDSTTFDVPLELRGTPFQRAVWAQLVAIPPGTTVSYLELARRIGNPLAVRAVGNANGKNPISVIVPCHRVVGASGTLVGYAGGLACKSWLLCHERADAPQGARGDARYGSWVDRASEAAR